MHISSHVGMLSIILHGDAIPFGNYSPLSVQFGKKQ